MLLITFAFWACHLRNVRSWHSKEWWIRYGSHSQRGRVLRQTYLTNFNHFWSNGVLGGRQGNISYWILESTSLTKWYGKDDLSRMHWLSRQRTTWAEVSWSCLCHGWGTSVCGSSGWKRIINWGQIGTVLGMATKLKLLFYKLGNDLISILNILALIAAEKDKLKGSVYQKISRKQIWELSDWREEIMVGWEGW